MKKLIEKDFEFKSKEDDIMGPSLTASINDGRVYLSGNIHEREVPELIKWLQSLRALEEE